MRLSWGPYNATTAIPRAMSLRWLRMILALGRPGQLPTVWSNCLAGWWLGGGHFSHRLPWLLGGTTLLYLGGVLLNDAFDVEFDQQHAGRKPIAAGEVEQKTVWNWGVGFLVAGSIALWGAGTFAGALGLGLGVAIILFNSLHRVTLLSPLLLGLCRLLVYLLGAGLGIRGVTGASIWGGLAVAAYVAGVAFLAVSPDLPSWRRTPHRFWPVALFGVPILLALVMNAGPFREPALLISAVLALWTAKVLRGLFWSSTPDARRAVAELVAGIVLVDWLAVAPVLPRELSLVFLGLFLLTLALEKAVSASLALRQPVEQKPG